jgi:thiol-disulfide isomerase/thioredoxin
MKPAGVLLALLVLLARPGAARAQDDAGIAVGDTLAPLVIHDLDGKDVNLGSIIGQKPVLLEFWASWCTSCAAMLPLLKAAHREFGDDVAFVGINVTVGDSREKARQYVEREAPPFMVLYDDAGTAAAAWDPPATSFIIIADRTGRVVYTGVGGTQNLTPALEAARSR